MPTARSLWRSLLTVFQIVALVAFSVAASGHSHAGTGPLGHDHRHGHAAMSAHGEAAGAEHGTAISDHGERAGEESASGPCGLHCCHVSVLRAEDGAVTVSWMPERRLAGIPSVAFDSVTAEALPEPPRTLA